MSRDVWTPLHAHLHQTLRERPLLERGQHLFVAVSGGQDSLCLLRLLLDLQPKWGWQMAIVHCNHRWREDADANAAWVESLAQSWGVPFFLRTAEIIPASEAAARQWRYDVFCEIAQQADYSAIVTGHTASDRAETLLYNLLRGSGTDGLQALTWRRSLASNLTLVRPLLGLTRTETGQFCQQFQLAVWEDSTNADLRYARNRIRHELLPYLATHFNPQAEPHLAQTAELLTADVDYLEQAAADLCEQATWQNHGLNRKQLRTAPLALQRRAVRQFLCRRLPCSPSFQHVEKVIALINAPNRSRTDPFPGGAIAEVRDDCIWLNHPVADANPSH